MWIARKETLDCVVVKQSKHPSADAAKQALHKMAGHRVKLTGEYLIYSDVIEGHRYTAIEVGGSVWKPIPKKNKWN